jgi:hypothetical protein
MVCLWCLTPLSTTFQLYRGGKKEFEIPGIIIIRKSKKDRQHNDHKKGTKTIYKTLHRKLKKTKALKY